MFRITNKENLSTGWLHDPPTIKELERLNIDKLWLLSKRKNKGLKKNLLDFVANNYKSV